MENVQRRQIVLDPLREHTESEVELVMYCFNCSKAEARSILKTPVSLEKIAEVRGMLDAVKLEQEIENGRKIEVPEWLKKIKNVII